MPKKHLHLLNDKGKICKNCSCGRAEEKIIMRESSFLSRVEPPLDIIDSEISLLVSYPRSGSHWINAMSELCLDKPRGPRQSNDGITWRHPKENEEFLWTFRHDVKLKINPSTSKHGDIFLYRNPVHAIYSLTKIEDNDLVIQANYYKNLFEKWISTAKTILVYEKAVEDPHGCLKLMCKHFDIEYQKENADKAIKICSKESIMNKSPGSTYHNNSVLTEKYKNERDLFYEKNYELIKKIVLTDKIKYYLDIINF